MGPVVEFSKARETDGTFTNVHLLKNWETLRLPPIFQVSTDALT